ncbi:Ankyrin repeat-containing domain [Phytophthora cactorum]|nr:Ankyrin repeat-containing domain [Phytophthora cactorum]
MEMPTPSSSVDHSEVVSSTTRTTSVSRRRSPPLHDAALNGDITLVSQMLNAGEDPDTRDEWSLTPIMSMFVRHALQDTRCIFQERHAVRRNLVTDCREEDAERIATTTAVLDLFLRHGAKPDACTNVSIHLETLFPTNKTNFVWFFTCREEKQPYTTQYATDYRVARTLLDAGASIDAQDKGGRSPLYCAVQERSLSVTNLLISYGASIDLQDKNGISPLSLVIEKGYLDVMQILLNHHELVATRERLDFTGEVLLQAAEVNSVEIVRLLLESEYVALDYQNAAGETAMLRAIAQGKTQM